MFSPQSTVAAVILFLSYSSLRGILLAPVHGALFARTGPTRPRIYLIFLRDAFAPRIYVYLIARRACSVFVDVYLPTCGHFSVPDGLKNRVLNRILCVNENYYERANVATLYNERATIHACTRYRCILCQQTETIPPAEPYRPTVEHTSWAWENCTLVSDLKNNSKKR